jgi:hypothetical protein
MKIKSKKNSFPFPFILDLLSAVEYEVKPMFGCHAIYSGEKILIIVRKKDNHKDSNGVWIATDHTHHESLRKTFNNLQSVPLLSGKGKETAWQMISYSDGSFEEKINLLCDLIFEGDLRIGKVPKVKAKTKKKH